MGKLFLAQSSGQGKEDWQKPYPAPSPRQIAIVMAEWRMLR